jgi:hypothetical protein
MVTCKLPKLKLSHYTPRRLLRERSYSSYSLWTSALDGGEWSASRPGRPLAPGKGPSVPIVQEAGWAHEPVWTQRLKEKSFRLYQGSNLDHPLFQPVARHYSDWATRLKWWHVGLIKVFYCISILLVSSKKAENPIVLCHKIATSYLQRTNHKLNAWLSKMFRNPKFDSLNMKPSKAFSSNCACRQFQYHWSFFCITPTILEWIEKKRQTCERVCNCFIHCNLLGNWRLDFQSPA